MQLPGLRAPAVVALGEDGIKGGARAGNVGHPRPRLVDEPPIDPRELADERCRVLPPLDLERRHAERDVTGHVLEQVVDLVVRPVEVRENLAWEVRGNLGDVVTEARAVADPALVGVADELRAAGPVRVVDDPLLEVGREVVVEPAAPDAGDAAVRMDQEPDADPDLVCRMLERASFRRKTSR